MSFSTVPMNGLYILPMINIAPIVSVVKYIFY